MGINQAPYIAQEMMERTLKNIADDLEIYIDDIGIFSESWDDHLIILDKVCKRLEDKVFSVNPLKCEFFSQGIRLPRTLADPQRRKTFKEEDPRNY